MALACRLDTLLQPFEVLEIFRKHASDPVKYSTAALAAAYDVEEELIVYLLKYTSVPEVVRVDNELYGVYEVKDIFEEESKPNTIAAPRSDSTLA